MSTNNLEGHDMTDHPHDHHDHNCAQCGAIPVVASIAAVPVRARGGELCEECGRLMRPGERLATLRCSCGEPHYEPLVCSPACSEALIQRVLGLRPA
jgi:hypothetical protein